MVNSESKTTLVTTPLGYILKNWEVFKLDALRQEIHLLQYSLGPTWHSKLLILRVRNF